MPKVSKKSLVQFAKYSAGGFAYFWVAWLVITFGEQYIGLWWANIIGNGAGITVNYLIQKYWTFTANKKSRPQLYRYIIITIVNLVLSYLILRILQDFDIPLWFAQFISAGFFSFWNWGWYKYWVFKV